MENLPWGVALVGMVLGAGGISALLRARSQNRKTNAQAEVTLGEGWQAFVEALRKDNNELRERVRVIEEKEEQCQRRLAVLESGEHSRVAEKKVTELVEQRLDQLGGRRGGPTR